MENKALAILSLVMGAVFALGFGLIMKLSFAETALTGLFCAAALFAALKISVRCNNRKYAEAEKEIGSEVLFKHNCNIWRDGKLCNGYIYVCEDALHIISLEKKPGEKHVLTYDEIESVRDISKVQIDILCKTEIVFSITTSDAMGLSYEINERIS